MADKQVLESGFVAQPKGEIGEKGTALIRIIQPGWGSSGYYPGEMLQRCAGIYKIGTHMYWNHPTLTEERERPERSLRDLAGVLTSEGQYLYPGTPEEGVYAEAKVFSPYHAVMKELAGHIGVSHIALGTAKEGEADGKRGQIIENLTEALSVDFVTKPGAGGKVMALFESMRSGAENMTKQVKEMEVSDEAMAALKAEIRQEVIYDLTVEELLEKRPDLVRAIQDAAKVQQAMDEQPPGEDAPAEEAARLKQENATLKETVARLQEAQMLQQAVALVGTQLAESKLPQAAKDRLAESLPRQYQAKEGQLDQDHLKGLVQESIKQESDYISQILGTGGVRGMGPGAGTTSAQESEQKLQAALAEMGLSESAAKQAAKGRN